MHSRFCEGGQTRTSWELRAENFVVMGSTVRNAKLKARTGVTQKDVRRPTLLKGKWKGEEKFLSYLCVVRSVLTIRALGPKLVPRNRKLHITRSILVRSTFPVSL